jgi:hypothetical protein
MGLPRAGARLLKSLVGVQQAPGLPRGNQEEPARLQEPPSLEAGASQERFSVRVLLFPRQQPLFPFSRVGGTSSDRDH